MYKMIQHCANNREFLLVEVPNDSRNIRIDHSWEPPKIYMMSNLQLIFIRLEQSGTYKTHCFSDEAKEQEAMDVVECKSVDTGGDDHYCYFRDYMDSSNEWPLINERDNGVIKSLQSLINHHFSSTQNRVLILEKIS